MTTLKAIHEHNHGHKLVIPYAGEVEISADGTVQVEDSIATKIVELDCGFEFQNDLKAKAPKNEIKPQVVKTDIKAQTEDSGAGVTNTTTVVETTTEAPVVENPLLKLTVPRLQELAAPFPKAEWGSLKKDELIIYLTDKLKQ